MPKANSLRDLPPPPAHKTGWPWTVESEPLQPTMPNGQAWPLISIVTPSFNQGEFIETTIRSVLLQGYPNLEYIVIDGGSTDQTVSIIKKYQPWLTYWVSEADKGQSDAINKGFRRTTGQILNWLNSDDYLERNALAMVTTAFGTAGSDVGALVGRCNWVNFYGEISPCNYPAEISRKTLMQWSVASDVWFVQPACFFTRSAWEYAGPAAEHLHYCMDLALWLKISERFKFQFLRENIAYAMRHLSAKTVDKWPYAQGEIALLFASLPDGYASATAVIEHLIDRELAAQAPFAVAKRALHQIGRQIGLGHVRRALRRLTT